MADRERTQSAQRETRHELLDIVAHGLHRAASQHDRVALVENVLKVR